MYGCRTLNYHLILPFDKYCNVCYSLKIILLQEKLLLLAVFNNTFVNMYILQYHLNSFELSKGLQALLGNYLKLKVLKNFQLIKIKKC